MMGRPYNRDTPLGQLMWQRGYSVKDFERATGISYRTISDYLAGRSAIIPKHMAAICDELDVPREVILGDVEPDSAQVRAHAGKLDTSQLVAGMVGAMTSTKETSHADHR